MVQKAITLGAELTENYTICHHNWLYEFLEPGDEEIIAAYVTLNGPEPHESDADESSSSSSDEESDDADADERAKRAIRCKRSDFEKRLPDPVLVCVGSSLVVCAVLCGPTPPGGRVQKGRGRGVMRHLDATPLASSCILHLDASCFLASNCIGI